MCNFKIGQEVVAIRDQPDGLFKKGQIFPVHGLRNSTCACGIVEVSIGIEHGLYRCCCDLCNIKNIETSGFVWFFSTNFSPLQTDSEEADMTEALKEVSERELFQV